MAPRIIAITLHPRKTEPLDITRLEIALQKHVVAIYGKESVLDFTEGKIGENPNEVMIDIKAEMSAATRHALEEALKKIFGSSIIVTHRGKPVRHNVAKAISQATKEVIESFQELDNQE